LTSLNFFGLSIQTSECPQREEKTAGKETNFLLLTDEYPLFCMLLMQ